MKKLSKIVFFSVLGLFLIGVLTTIAIIILVPAGEMDDIKLELPPPVEQTEQPSDPVPTEKELIETEYEKMSKQAVHQLHPLDLIKAYNTDTITADAKYKTKIVRLRGIIRNITMDTGFHSVHLASGNMPESVLCRMRIGHEATLKDYKKGQEVFVVGSVEGKKDHVTLFNCLLARVPQKEKTNE